VTRRTAKRTPAEQAVERAARAERKAEVDALRARGLTVTCDAGYNIIVTQRLDVFALLHSRKSLTDTQLYAVRRLEQYQAIANGHERPEQSFDRVDKSSEGAPGQNVTQAMIDAHRDLRAIYLTTGAKSSELLIALTQPQEGILTRWRDTVQHVTGEHDERVQGAMIRAACENLGAAWQAFDYRARERKARAA
jgi:hypothetical protein